MSEQYQSTVLISNTRVFDGTSDELTEPMSVLVEGNKITGVGASARCRRDSLTRITRGRLE